MGFRVSFDKYPRTVRCEGGFSHLGRGKLRLESPRSLLRPQGAMGFLVSGRVNELGLSGALFYLREPTDTSRGGPAGALALKQKLRCAHAPLSLLEFNYGTFKVIRIRAVSTTLALRSVCRTHL